jgi:hypothetical protein
MESPREKFVKRAQIRVDYKRTSSGLAALLILPLLGDGGSTIDTDTARSLSMGSVNVEKAGMKNW